METDQLSLLILMAPVAALTSRSIWTKRGLSEVCFKVMNYISGSSVRHRSLSPQWRRTVFVRLQVIYVSQQVGLLLYFKQEWLKLEQSDPEYAWVSFTSAFSGNNHSFLSCTPAHGSASNESENVALLRGKSCDGELPSIGPHLHCSPALRVPAVEAVGDLVA